MPKRIPLGAIGVTRDGKTVYPAVGTAISGEPFDFTAEEIAEIVKLEKASGNQLLRKLIVETSSDDQGTAPPAQKALSAMNLEELTAEAAKRELDPGEAKTKADFRALIEAAIEAEDL